MLRWIMTNEITPHLDIMKVVDDLDPVLSKPSAAVMLTDYGPAWYKLAWLSSSALVIMETLDALYHTISNRHVD